MGIFLHKQNCYSTCTHLGFHTIGWAYTSRFVLYNNMAIMEHITPFTHHRRLQEELHDDVEVLLTCNTEKDRHIRLNECTAGMHDTLIKLCMCIFTSYICMLCRYPWSYVAMWCDNNVMRVVHFRI